MRVRNTAGRMMRRESPAKEWYSPASAGDPAGVLQAESLVAFHVLPVTVSLSGDDLIALDRDLYRGDGRIARSCSVQSR